MLLAALSAVFSPRVSERAQAHLQGLFYPVSKPAYAVSDWVHERTIPRKTRDDGSPEHPRDLAEVYQENTDLRMQVKILQADLQRLQELNADRDKIGDLRSRCTPVEVVGGDAGLSDSSRMLSGGSLRGLAENMPVICPDGIVGQLTKVGATSSRVRFITDKGVTVIVSFARVEKDDAGKARMVNASYPDCVAIGQGEGKMIVTNKPWKDLNGSVKVNDWVMLNDKDKNWRNLVYRIGRVTAVQQQKGDVKFGEIMIESMVDPTRLKEVMVVVK
jgi:cell shape-determining protein MreC